MVRLFGAAEYGFRTGEIKRFKLFYKKFLASLTGCFSFRGTVTFSTRNDERDFTSIETMVSFIRFMYFKVTEVRKSQGTWQPEQDQRD